METKIKFTVQGYAFNGFFPKTEQDVEEYKPHKNFIFIHSIERKWKIFSGVNFFYENICSGATRDDTGCNNPNPVRAKLNAINKTAEKQ